MSEDKKDFFLPLQSLAETSPLYLTALYNDALAIKRKLLEGKFISSESEIDTVVLGNEFTFPLLIAVPLLNDRDLNYLRNSNEANLQGIPIRLLPESVKAEKLSDEQRNLYERFFYLQFLSRYKGEDQSLLTIKKRIFGEFEKMGVKQRLFEAEQVSLGDPVDFYDFSKLSQEYISNLVERSDLPEEYKETIFALWKKRKKFINFSYPLGDNTYGLIESLKNVFPNIKDIAFFGKVGATMQWDGENHLGARVGRVVLPDYVSSVNNFNPKEFIEKTKLYGIKIPVIDFDKIELIFQSEGVLLQTLSDIKKAQQAIINNPNIPYNDKVRLLIDMESWYLNLVCQKFNIEPTVAYYISDNSGIPPFVPGEKGTILTSLGPRGSFSVLISGLIVLRNIS